MLTRQSLRMMKSTHPERQGEKMLINMDLLVSQKITLIMETLLFHVNLMAHYFGMRRLLEEQLVPWTSHIQFVVAETRLFVASNRKTPKFAQLYIFDNENEITNRINAVRGCQPPNYHCGGVRTTIHHHSCTLWCRVVMAQPLGVSQSGQPPKTTAVVAAEPVENTTAAPCGVGLVV
nr:hypothetical protein [Tanacetum cinerariifolium]